MPSFDLSFGGPLAANIALLSEVQPLLQAAAIELKARSERIMGLSKRLAPVRNKHGGTLRASGVVLPAEFSGTQVTSVMGYGGAANAYALSAHENPRTGKTGGRSPSGKKYSSWSEVGQWKFLEQPFLAEKNGVLEGLAQAIRRDFDQRIRRSAA